MRKAVALFIALICVVFFAAVCYAEDLIPFSAMKSELPNTWRQTFDTVNGSVIIDTVIQTPERDTIPLVELYPYLFRADELATVFQEAYIDVDTVRSMVQMGNFASCVYPEKVSQCGWTAWPPESEYAENVSLSRTELKQRVHHLLQQLTIPDETDYCVMGIVAHSRTWLVDQNDMPAEPLNDHGYYDVYLQSKINDLSIIDSFCFNQDNDKLHGPHIETPQMSYFDDQNYTFYLSGYHVSKVLWTDCPMLPFAIIQNEIERLVVTGHLREIYRFELCYIPMWSDDGKTIIAIPAWVIWGEYHEEATTSTNQEPAGYYQKVIGGYPLVIPAQTGKALDYTNQSKERWTASTYLLGENK